MAMTLDDLKKLLNGESIKYFVDPNRPVIMAGFGGVNGQYQVIIRLEVEGTFLQFRTMSYLHCPADHGSLTEVLKVLGGINYRKRLVKFGWDSSDGEIVAYADIWIVDTQLTGQQLHHMLYNFIPVIDSSYARIKETIETGTDPGEKTPEELAGEVLGKGGGGLPPAVTELLRKLAGRKPGADPEPVEL